ncbi:MAG: GGDEF domain-containing protein [Chloroflexi bacterium]|nr:GGDEF domain-containing protein [Chloroflexota bacterium]
MLRWVPCLLQSNLRPTAKLAGYGEETAITITEVEHREVCTMAERVRAHVSEQPFCAPLSDGSVVRMQIAVSAGVAEMQGDATNAEMLISTADKALYEAKRNGRDRTVLFRAMKQHPLTT